MNLSDNLKRIRKENNLTQEELAEKLNVSRQSVSKWESGTAYPEMDKMIQLCKMFDLNIDELLNKNINDERERKQSKVNVNKYIDDFLSFISKTVNMFCSLKLGGKIKLLIEEAILVLALYIASLIVGDILETFVRGILSFLPYNVFSVIFNILNSIYYIGAVILGVVILLHIFKIRYLDYYVVVDKEEKDEEEIKDENVKEEKKDKKAKLERKEDKVIIRDPSHAGYGFISGLLKVILFIIKLIVIGFGVLGCMSLIGFCAALASSFVIIKSGLMFLGVLICLLGIIAVHLVILILMFDFIVNRKPNYKHIIFAFFSGIVLTGIGIGISIAWVKDITYVNSYDGENILRSEKVYEMEDGLYFHNGYSNINYVETEDSSIRVSYDYAKFCEVNFDKNGKEVYIYNSCFNDEKEVVKSLIDQFNSKKIVDPDHLEVTIYTNKDNIEALKNNKTNERINSLEKENEELRANNEELNSLLDQKQNELDGLHGMLDDIDDE